MCGLRWSQIGASSSADIAVERWTKHGVEQLGYPVLAASWFVIFLQERSMGGTRRLTLGLETACTHTHTRHLVLVDLSRAHIVKRACQTRGPLMPCSLCGHVVGLLCFRQSCTRVPETLSSLGTWIWGSKAQRWTPKPAGFVFFFFFFSLRLLWWPFSAAGGSSGAEGPTAKAPAEICAAASGQSNFSRISGISQ